MPTVVECDAADLARRGRAWLEAEPVLHNVICTVLARALSEPGRFSRAGWFLVTEDDDGVPRPEDRRPAGVAILTPPYPLGLTPMPDSAVAALADALAESRPDLPGVSGEVEVATTFARLWRDRTGTAVERGMDQGMYRLDAVVPPPAASGRLRRASEGDLPLLREWRAAFDSEVGVVREADDVTARWVAQGGMHVWEDGSVVSMAGALPPVAGVARIAAVYSPPAMRGRGYATSCVAALSQRLLDGGASACMLYTDQANPTSNAIYRRIGYRLVRRCAEYRFSPG